MSPIFDIESSKSIFNRALIIQAFNPQITLLGQSSALDIKYLQQALKDFNLGLKSFYVGEAGTGLRFLSFFLSRFPGEYLINGATSLFSRPKNGLDHLLTQLGCQIFWTSQSLKIVSKGWVLPQILHLPHIESSQFLSGLLLSTWKINHVLEIQFNKTQLGSLSYLNLTLDLMSYFGFQYEWTTRGIRVQPHQIPTSINYLIEPDASSVAALLMAGCLKGHFKIKNATRWLQPDIKILELLSLIKAPIQINADTIEIKKATSLQPIHIDLDQNPDLAPCLAVVTSFASGQSTLSGLHRLKFKESNRLQNISQLLTLAGISFKSTTNQLTIEGKGIDHMPPTFEFDPDNDHRMAMAAGLFQLKNPQIKILNPQCVNKSFPQFWSLINQL